MKWKIAETEQPIAIATKGALNIRYKGTPELLWVTNGKWYWAADDGERTKYPVDPTSWQVIEYLDETPSSSPVPVEQDKLREALSCLYTAMLNYDGCDPDDKENYEKIDAYMAKAMDSARVALSEPASRSIRHFLLEAWNAGSKSTYMDDRHRDKADYDYDGGPGMLFEEWLATSALAVPPVQAVEQTGWKPLNIDAPLETYIVIQNGLGAMMVQHYDSKSEIEWTLATNSEVLYYVLPPIPKI